VLVDELGPVDAELAAFAEQPLLLRGQVAEERLSSAAGDERRGELLELVAEPRA
jgi:hypothetical protein